MCIVSGSWGPDQTVSATVTLTGTPSGVAELEVRVRNTINTTAHTLTGYEIYCTTVPGQNYCHIATWQNPHSTGTWSNLDGSFPGDCSCTPGTGSCSGATPTIVLNNGDVITASVTGTSPVTITGQVKTSGGTTRVTWSCIDTGKAGWGPWTSGAPGVGFFDNIAPGNLQKEGFSTFHATDGVSSTPPLVLSPPTLLRVVP